MQAKRLSILAISLLVLSALLIIAARHSSGQPNQQPTLRMKIIRGKDTLRNKPTRQEIASFKAAQQGEREFEDSIPKHVPIQIKIRKEKEKQFKDLANERWARDFELEVKNVGSKPIYEFYLLLLTDVKAAAGYQIIAPLTYGRPELADLKARPQPDDIPLNPGDSCILKIHPGQLDAWDWYRTKENRPNPRKIQIKLEGMSFGDGTGYVGNQGQAIPHSVSEASGAGGCLDNPNRAGPLAKFWNSLALRSEAGPVSRYGQPARTIAGYFLRPSPFPFGQIHLLFGRVAVQGMDARR